MPNLRTVAALPDDMPRISAGTTHVPTTPAVALPPVVQAALASESDMAEAARMGLSFPEFLAWRVSPKSPKPPKINADLLWFYSEKQSPPKGAKVIAEKRAVDRWDTWNNGKDVTADGGVWSAGWRWKFASPEEAKRHTDVWKPGFPAEAGWYIASKGADRDFARYFDPAKGWSRGTRLSDPTHKDLRVPDPQPLEAGTTNEEIRWLRAV